jgi:flagellar biosynthetic protein FliR
MNIIMGLLVRVAPQLNIFSIGMILGLLVGFVVLISSLPAITTFLQNRVEDLPDLLEAFLAELQG